MAFGSVIASSAAWAWSRFLAPLVPWMSLWIFFSRGSQIRSAFFCSSSSAICASVIHRLPYFL